MNINDYIRYKGKYSFAELEFNDIDSLILSELSYMNLDLIAPSIHTPNKRKVKIKNVSLKNLHSVSYGSVDAKKNETMLKLMMKSKRYQDIEICYTHRIFDSENANQFFAVTFFLPNKTAYIAYRGTDISIIGWKENFYFTYKKFILGQREALEYIKCVSKYFKENFYLGGHSKGGNLALYAALNMGEKLEERLIKVQTFDGPGFKEGLVSYPSYERIKDKMVKYITYNDLVGMFFNNFTNPLIVNSTGVLLGGHDPFYWQVRIKNDSFKLMKNRSALSKKSERGFNRWLSCLTIEDRILAVEAFFKVFKRVRTVYDLLRYGVPDIFETNKVLKKHYDEETQKRIKGMLSKFVKYFAQSMTQPLEKSK